MNPFTNPWLIKNAPEIRSELKNLVKNSNFFFKPFIQVKFSSIKACNLSENIKKFLTFTSDDDNIVFGILPDMILNNSIEVTLSESPNNNFYYDKTSFMLYINLYSKTLGNNPIVKAQSNNIFLVNKKDIANGPGERIQFTYSII